MDLETLWDAIDAAYLADQASCLKNLLSRFEGYPEQNILHQAQIWVRETRARHDQSRLTTAFLREYQLNSDEGIILMSIAEALLRIPDSRTQDVFLQEKLTAADWQKHLQHSDSLIVNLSTGALLLTGKLEHLAQTNDQDWHAGYERLLGRLGAPMIRTALTQAMHFLAGQFVIAETIGQALAQSRDQSETLYSYDMLGEAAITYNEASSYDQSYHQAISAIAEYARPSQCFKNHGISVKLSALYPRYEALHYRSAVAVLSERLKKLACAAQSANINLTIDAEESARLEMSLVIFEKLFSDPDLKWPGLGLAVQAYQKRAIKVIDWLAELSRKHQKIIPVRLVKGAYWDTEIKLAQQQGLQNYPVFTNKAATDVSYLACAKRLIDHKHCFYPQFATHNAHTVAALLNWFGSNSDFELQRLHGMGEGLYQQILSTNTLNCRIYAPVGQYRDLLPYLIRRLLENGANNSFINQLDNPDLEIEEVVHDPVCQLRNSGQSPHDNIPLPEQLYGTERLNSTGLNLNQQQTLNHLANNLLNLSERQWQSQPLVNGTVYYSKTTNLFNPGDIKKQVGTVMCADPNTIKKAMAAAAEAYPNWRLSPVEQRIEYLNRTADLLEQHKPELMSLCIREAGRTLPDAESEIREAVDFCRYYAACAGRLFKQQQALPGPVGESNHLGLYGRGVFACISPWNFPIALFIGQISAALAAGNTVIAKPANLTPLTAMYCIRLMHQAGFPKQVLHFLPGDGHTIGKILMADHRIQGVAFTGSGETAAAINRQLAKQQQIKTLIAETGGQNIMIADSSALPEQLVRDAVQSAFNSAGQRCSALRVLFVQSDIADQVIEKLTGAMQTLKIGNPSQFDTDIGPVISGEAYQQLNQHLQFIKPQAKLFYQAELPKNLDQGFYFAPALIEIDRLEQLPEEIFGPILHLIRFKSGETDNIIKAVNRSGYGLTLGIHSRIEKHIHEIQTHAQVGNIYVNRNMIGAVVGSQPFGGMGLSGTGPKAGGPYYLQRFAVEQTFSVNTAAIGGNAQLLASKLN